MTIFPQKPHLENSQTSEVDKKVLLEKHLTVIPIGLGFSLLVLLKPGLTTDGASVPKQLISEESSEGIKIRELIYRLFPKDRNEEELLQKVFKLIGTPFEMPRLLAAIVHDALYGLKWHCRWLCDRIYRRILLQVEYDEKRLAIEYCAIRLAGWRNWQAVEKEEVENHRKLVEVAIVRTRNIDKKIKELKAKE